MTFERVGHSEAAAGLRRLAEKALAAGSLSSLRSATVSVLGYGVEAITLDTELRSPRLPPEVISNLGNVVAAMTRRDAAGFLLGLAALLERMDGRANEEMIEVPDLLDLAWLTVAYKHLTYCAAADPWMPQFMAQVEDVIKTWPPRGGINKLQDREDVAVLLNALKMYADDMRSISNPFGRIHATAAAKILAGSWQHFVTVMALRESMLRVRDTHGKITLRIKASEFEKAKAKLAASFSSSAAMLFLISAEQRLA